MSTAPAAAVGEAIERGVLGERLWFYSNYHCNLACSYCLTESAPSAVSRELDLDVAVALAEEGKRLGFRSLGVTGGEPFLLSEMPDLLLRLTEVMPTLVLSNGTLFAGGRLERLRPLAPRPLSVQVSLDRSEPEANDAMRGPENFRRVVEAIPRLIDIGIKVRIASTLEVVNEEDMDSLCRLHRRLGVPDQDHVVRRIVRRGRAKTEGLGTEVGTDELAPELTVTADGAFWSPFAPTVREGRLDTDLLVTRTIRPLTTPAVAISRLAESAGSAGAMDDRFT